MMIRMLRRVRTNQVGRAILIAAVAQLVLTACSSPYEDSGASPPAALPEAGAGGCDGASSPKCGTHGRCDGMPASCICQPGYVGPTCAACAEGFQDHDGDGTCTPSCASAATKCAPHESCDDTTGLATCLCVTGYEREAEGCVFHGGPADPGFQAAPSPWSASGNASIASGAPVSTVTGAVDMGLARFHGAGAITQSFDMPPFENAEPLALEVNSGCKAQCNNVANDALAIMLGDRALDMPLGFDALASRRVCLGERAYGRKVSLSVRAFVGLTPADKPDDDAFLDRVAFVPAPDCPPPGAIANGDFEKAGAWTTGGQGTTEVAPGIGTNGSRAGRLAGNACERPSLASILSVPEKLDRPALLFSIRGTRDRDASIALDNRTIASIHGTGAFVQAVVCLPEWARGFAHTLKITAGERYSTCNLSGPNEVIVDDFTIASHPSCDTAPFVLDGDFERKVGNAWAEGVGDGVSVAVVHDDVATAHGGSSLLQLNTFECPRSVIADGWIGVPARPGAGAVLTGGPSMKFFYRTANASTAVLTGGGKVLAPSQDVWKEERVCLPPSSWGRAFNTGFSVTASSGVCDASLLVDDVSVLIDPACPAD